MAQPVHESKYSITMAVRSGIRPLEYPHMVPPQNLPLNL